MANLIKGQVQAVNSSGDLVTDIPVTDISEVPGDDSVSVKFGPHQTSGIFDSNHSEPESTLMAVRGASGFLELTIVGISLSEMLAVGVGEEVEISW